MLLMASRTGVWDRNRPRLRRRSRHRRPRVARKPVSWSRTGDSGYVSEAQSEQVDGARAPSSRWSRQEPPSRPPQHRPPSSTKASRLPSGDHPGRPPVSPSLVRPRPVGPDGVKGLPRSHSQRAQASGSIGRPRHASCRHSPGQCPERPIRRRPWYRSQRGLKPLASTPVPRAPCASMRRRCVSRRATRRDSPSTRTRGLSLLVSLRLSDPSRAEVTMSNRYSSGPDKPTRHVLPASVRYVGVDRRGVCAPA